ncbi:MAG: IS1380 family transposase, partial [Desulfosoma sp.]
MTEKPLLVRLDAAHDAVETRAELSAQENTDFIVKWNPRRAKRAYWAHKVCYEGRVLQVRRGK